MLPLLSSQRPSGLVDLVAVLLLLQLAALGPQALTLVGDLAPMLVLLEAAPVLLVRRKIVREEALLVVELLIRLLVVVVVVVVVRLVRHSNNQHPLVLEVVRLGNSHSLSQLVVACLVVGKLQVRRQVGVVRGTHLSPPHRFRKALV